MLIHKTLLSARDLTKWRSCALNTLLMMRSDTVVQLRSELSFISFLSWVAAVSGSGILHGEIECVITATDCEVVPRNELQLSDKP